MLQQVEYVQFFTATLLQRKHLKPDKYKQIILDSLRFLVEQNRVKVYGFVIMINHIHIIWHIQSEHKRENVQRDFLKYTAQQIQSDLEKHHPKVLPSFFSECKRQEVPDMGTQSLKYRHMEQGSVMENAPVYASKPGKGRCMRVAAEISLVVGYV